MLYVNYFIHSLQAPYAVDTTTIPIKQTRLTDIK